MAIEITPRDLKLLEVLYHWRVAYTSQLLAPFGESNNIYLRRRLARMEKEGLLMTQRAWGGQTVWRLGTRGILAVVRGNGGEENIYVDRKLVQKFHPLASDLAIASNRLEHQLACTDVYVGVLPHLTDGYELVDNHEIKDTGVVLGGVLPDMLFLKDRKPVYAIEVDLGSERLKALVAKFVKYRRSFLTVPIVMIAHATREMEIRAATIFEAARLAGLEDNRVRVLPWWPERPLGLLYPKSGPEELRKLLYEAGFREDVGATPLTLSTPKGAVTPYMTVYRVRPKAQTFHVAGLVEGTAAEWAMFPRYRELATPKIIWGPLKLGFEYGGTDLRQVFREAGWLDEEPAADLKGE
jgi:hypothetical protein